MRDKIKRWWQGEPEEPVIGPGVIIYPGGTRRHWTARIAHNVAEWHQENWAKFWPIVIAALALMLLAYKFFGHGV